MVVDEVRSFGFLFRSVSMSVLKNAVETWSTSEYIATTFLCLISISCIEITIEMAI